MFDRKNKQKSMIYNNIREVNNEKCRFRNHQLYKVSNLIFLHKQNKHIKKRKHY